MKTKRGFTLIELLIVLIVIGVLVSLIAFRYKDAQLRARTAENTKRANDIINVAEQQIALALSGDERGYPDPRPNAYGQKTEKWKKFLEMIPPGSARHLGDGAGWEPSGANPERLRYVACREGGAGSDIISGIKIVFWDHVERKTSEVTTGEVKGSGIFCN